MIGRLLGRMAYDPPSIGLKTILGLTAALIAIVAVARWDAARTARRDAVSELRAKQYAILDLARRKAEERRRRLESDLSASRAQADQSDARAQSLEEELRRTVTDVKVCVTPIGRVRKLRELR